MENNEQKMKDKGVSKVYKDITTKAGNTKNVSSTQVGQQMLFDEALRILPEVKEWIDKKNGRSVRMIFKEYFSSDEILLEKIIWSSLLRRGSREGS